MATRENEEEEILTSGHEAVFDWTCGQCESDGKTSEAMAYCRACDEGFCDCCLKLHNRFSALKNHRVLDKSQADKWGKDAAIRGSGFPCYDHDDQTISMYCGEHDVVCCAVCVALDHKGCGDMAYIPKVSKGVVKSKEFIKTQNDVLKTITETENALDQGGVGKETLARSRREAAEAVREAKQEIIDHFDKLEDEAIADIDRLHEKLEQESGEMVDTCSNSCQELQSLSQQMRSDTHISDSEAFVLMKIGKKKLLECRSVSQKLSYAISSDTFNITFRINHDLQNTKAITAIGDVERSRKECAYNLIGQYECNLDMQGDYFHTVVCGIHQLPNGTFLLSDQSNCKLKLLNLKYKLVGSCDLPSEPSQLSSTDRNNPTEVAVALLDDSLQFTSVTDQIKLTKLIRLDYTCNGLLLYNRKVYISDGEKSVYIYTFANKNHLQLVRFVRFDKNGESLFSSSQDLTFNISSESAGVIFVADNAKGIVSLDLDGNHMQTQHHPDIGGCFKAVTGNGGHIFVIKEDRRLLQLGKDGRTVLGVITTDARQFHLDTSNSVLYVWCWGTPGGSQRLKIFKATRV